MTDLTIFVVIGCDGVERFRIQDFSWGKTNNLSSCSHTESILEELANRSPEIKTEMNFNLTRRIMHQSINQNWNFLYLDFIWFSFILQAATGKGNIINKCLLGFHSRILNTSRSQKSEIQDCLTISLWNINRVFQSNQYVLIVKIKKIWIEFNIDRKTFSVCIPLLGFSLSSLRLKGVI